jgi:hypothetical protein
MVCRILMDNAGRYVYICITGITGTKNEGTYIQIICMKLGFQIRSNEIQTRIYRYRSEGIQLKFNLCSFRMVAKIMGHSSSKNTQHIVEPVTGM